MSTTHLTRDTIRLSQIIPKAKLGARNGWEAIPAGESAGAGKGRKGCTSACEGESSGPVL